MTGLVLKDVLVMRRSLKTYILLMVFYLVMAMTGALPPTFALSFIEVILLVLPLSAFAYDEQARWDKCVLALPLSLRTVVKARYCFLLLLVLVSAALSGLLCVFFSLSGRSDALESSTSAAACLGAGMLIPAVMLPLNYKLGRERAQPFLYVVVIGAALAVFALSRLGLPGWLDLSFFRSMTDGQAAALFALCPLAGLAALFVSFLISCGIMGRKECC